MVVAYIHIFLMISKQRYSPKNKCHDSMKANRDEIVAAGKSG